MYGCRREGCRREGCMGVGGRGVGGRDVGDILALAQDAVVRSSPGYTAHATAGRVQLQAREHTHRTASTGQPESILPATQHLDASDCLGMIWPE